MNTRPSGPICSCTRNETDCITIREQEWRTCCWACEHTSLPPDVRPMKVTT